MPNEISKYENIPQEMKDVPQWVLWRYDGNPDPKTGKRKKAPIDASTGYKADKAKCQVSFETAINALSKFSGHGLGFVFTEIDPFTGIDFDDCFDESGNLKQDVKHWVDRLDSYTEYSPSGKGIHVIVKSDIVETLKKQQIEIYHKDRYFTVTGDLLPYSNPSIRYVNGEVTELRSEYAGTQKPVASIPTLGKFSTNRQPALTAQDILERLRNYPNAVKLLALPADGINSENTLSFLNMLKLPQHCNGNADLMEEVVKLTPFYRDKWDSKRKDSTWGREQIAKALNNYTPRGLVVESHTGLNGQVTEEPLIDDITAGDHKSPTWVDYKVITRRLGYTFRLNELDDSLECNDKKMTDAQEAEIFTNLHAKGLRQRGLMEASILRIANDNRYHPVKDYLEGLEWDGIDHIAQLATYFTDAHDPIVYADGTERKVFHAWLYRWLIGAVGKVYDSTLHQNPMLMLDGPQGIGKSFFAWWICPNRDLTMSGAIRPEDKDYMIRLCTKFVWEVSELGSTFRKADREALKDFITMGTVTVRPAYGRHNIIKPALASFIGTVNGEEGLLNDPSGYRRFLPVTITKIDQSYSQMVDRDQLWAQAFSAYNHGVAKLTEEEKLVHTTLTGNYEAVDLIEEYLNMVTIIDPGDHTSFTPTTDILKAIRLKCDTRESDKAIQMRVSNILKKKGIEKVKITPKGSTKQVWGYVGVKIDTRIVK